MKKGMIVLLGILMIALIGCGRKKYRLELDGHGLSSKRTAYAEGDTVKVTFDLIATDTDYSFYLDCDDTELDRDYENGVFILTFRMPAHDVKLTKSSRNTMVCVPTVTITFENRIGTADVWIMEDTPENRKQSVWGDTTVKACAANEPLEIVLEAVSDDDLYIIRMIDGDGFFYEACGVEITDGQTVVIRSEEDRSGTSVCVSAGEGSPVSEYEMFAAAL